MTSAQAVTTDTPDPLQEPAAPACVMSFNASDPSGAGGLAGDVATIAAMGAHALPVVTTIVMRDTAEVFDHHPLDAEVVVEQARSCWKTSPGRLEGGLPGLRRIGQRGGRGAERLPRPAAGVVHAAI